MKPYCVMPRLTCRIPRLRCQRLFLKKISTFVMDRWYCFVALLSSTVPKLIPHLKINHFSVIKTKIVSNCQYCVLQKWIPDQPLYQRCFSSCARAYKAYLNILVNLFCVFLQNLHKWIVYRVVFVRNYETVTNTTFSHFLEAILTNRVSTRDHWRLSGFGIVSKKTADALHETF